MKKEFIEYINGERNAVQDEFIISRERAPSAEHIHVSHPEIRKPMYAFWHGTDKGVKEIVTVSVSDSEEKKGTGGKRLYAKVMIDKVEELIKEGLSIEAFGFLLCLCGRGLEWGTGKVCRPSKRRVYRKAMVIEQLASHTNTSVWKTKKLIQELTAHDVIQYDRKEKAYFLSRELFIKGR